METDLPRRFRYFKYGSWNFWNRRAELAYKPHTALFCVMIVAIWGSVGYNMIILLAGMQGISRSYYEAAAIDGAGPVKQFFKITIPLLSPTIFFVMITGLIGAFQVFDSIYMMVDPVTNPAFNKVKTMNVLFYQNAFYVWRKKVMQQQFLSLCSQ